MASTSHRLRAARRAVALVWSASGALTAAWCVVLLLQGLLPVGMVYLTKPLVDGVQGLIAAGAEWRLSVDGFVRPALAMVVLVALSELLKVALQWVSFAQSERVTDHILDLVHAKASAIDLGNYENAEFLDRLYRVRSDSTQRPLALLESLGSLAQNGITTLGILALLITYGWGVSILLVVGTVPAFVVVLRASRQYHDWWTGTTAERRRADYFSGLLTAPAAAAEVRLYGLAPGLRARFTALRSTLRRARLALLRRQTALRFAAESVSLASAGAAVGWMVWRAVQGIASLGDIALFYQAFQRGQGLVKALFSGVNQVYNNTLFLDVLFDFLELEPSIVAPTPTSPMPDRPVREVRFVDVTFRYPGAERAALDRFNLSIPAGRCVAIVGANGAGKSTLVKLLGRFYDPQEGRVEIDGVDLRAMDPAALRDRLTIMFQVPVQYQDTVLENVALSDRGHALDMARVGAAARAAGAQDLIAGLPHGFETLLGRTFAGGTELSGGEWQRIAMARAFYRASPIVVLDEPTSQMDSWAESEWFERFHALTRGATAVVITHRLSIARRADLIHVMDEGRIVESGTHEELLRAAGRYATSWSGEGDS